jgi:hypothetical protein
VSIAKINMSNSNKQIEDSILDAEKKALDSPSASMRAIVNYNTYRVALKIQRHPLHKLTMAELADTASLQM